MRDVLRSAGLPLCSQPQTSTSETPYEQMLSQDQEEVLGRWTNEERRKRRSSSGQR